VRLDVADPAHRAVIMAARAWGVPVSVFLGRVRTEGVPDWLEEDRRAALDLAEWEAGLCPGCREPLAETTLAENEERYVAEVAGLCHRCVATEQLMTRLEEKKRPYLSALLVSVKLREKP
jgi:hypothetical protein